VLMSYIVPPEHALWALCHEPDEPWTGDINKPLKMLLPELERIATPAGRATLIQLGLDPDAKPSTIKRADHIMLATEQRDLMPKKRAIAWDRGVAIAWEPIPPSHWTSLAGIEPLERRIWPWTPEQAKRAFIQRYQELIYAPEVEQEGTLIWSSMRQKAIAA